MIRAFLGVSIPSRMRFRFAALQASLQEVLPPVRWVKPESIHLTLRFLGGVDAPRIAELETALAPIAERMEPFECDIRGLGGFPNLRTPTVLWVGVHEGRAHLDACARDVEPAIASSGFAPPHDAFHPHLTLARVKTDPRKVGKALVESGLADGTHAVGRLRVDRITLFESVRGPHGATYTPLTEFAMDG